MNSSILSAVSDKQQVRKKERAISFLEVEMNAVQQRVSEQPTLEELLADALYVEDQYAFILKKTPYTSSPIEAMAVLLHPQLSNVSQLTELPADLWVNLASELIDHFWRGAKFQGYEAMYVSINQQEPACAISSKFDDRGLEVKTQTIDRLHLHLFPEERNSIGVTKLVSEMCSEDQVDFFDSPAIEFARLFHECLTEHKGEISTGIPYGIAFSPKNIRDALSITHNVQEQYSSFYKNRVDTFLTLLRESTSSANDTLTCSPKIVPV